MVSYEVTGELLKSAVAANIRKAFAVTSGTPPVVSYPIITKERTLQGLDKPSFFIWQMELSQTQVSKDTFERLYQMNVRYFPEESTELYEELDSIGNKLMHSLRIVEIPLIVGKDAEDVYVAELKPVRGTDLEYKIQEDVLQAFANYTIRVKLPKEAQPEMVELTINEAIKN